MDFRTTTDTYRYGVRVTAIIMQDGHLLTYKVDGQNHLVGGAIEVGEISRDAIRREVREELGVDCRVKYLMFVVENCFNHNNEQHHMIEFHYKVELLGRIPKHTLDEHAFECEWVPLDNISQYDIRPKFLSTTLLEWHKNVMHIVVTIDE